MTSEELLDELLDDYERAVWELVEHDDRFLLIRANGAHALVADVIKECAGGKEPFIPTLEQAALSLEDAIRDSLTNPPWR